MSGPTPGPWRAKTSRVVEGPAWRYDYTGQRLTYEREVAWAHPVPTAMGGESARLATARLIAAAPDLLEALEQIMLAALSSDATKQQIADMAHAAIAKARGQ